MKGLRWPSPTLAIAFVALFAALAGGVYAAAKIDGHTIKAKSLPGNRLVLGSVPSNRLKPGSIPGSRLAPGSITGTQVDTATLGQVPTAVHADTADSARDAGTALTAVNAVNAEKVNGYGAGCKSGTRAFAGACWQNTPSQAATTAPAAALSCATQGGELPGALALAAFSQQPEVKLDAEGEWSEDVPSIAGAGVYAVITVSPAGVLDFVASTETKHYRCVIPLVS